MIFFPEDYMIFEQFDTQPMKTYLSNGIMLNGWMIERMLNDQRLYILSIVFDYNVNISTFY